MLDLYLIKDSQNASEKNLTLIYVGGINDDLFFQLQQEGIIEPWFDYYSKVRWSSEIVARMLVKLEQRLLPPTKLQKERMDFIAVLQKAREVNSGLVAFGD